METKHYSSIVTGKIVTLKFGLDEHFNARQIEVTLKFKVQKEKNVQRIELMCTKFIVKVARHCGRKLSLLIRSGRIRTLIHNCIVRGFRLLP